MCNEQISSEFRAKLSSSRIGLAVLASLETLFTYDYYLLQVNANERSITFRFGIYLQQHFSDWHVDCEYNRDGIEPKKLEHLDLNPDREDTEAQTVFPDVVVHKRGSQEESNLLVIEFKKTSSRVDEMQDIKKLQGYKRQLGYKYALFIKLGVGDDVRVDELTWI